MGSENLYFKPNNPNLRGSTLAPQNLGVSNISSPDLTQYIKLDTGEYVSKSDFNNLSPENQALLKQLGVTEFNRQQNAKISAQQADLANNYVLLNDGTYISKWDYENLSAENKSLVMSLGVDGFNAEMKKREIEFTTTHTKLANGDYVANDDYSKLTPEQQAELNALGVKGYNDKLAAQAAIAKAEYDAFLANNVHLGSGEWINREFWDTLNPDDQQLLSDMGVWAFSRNHYWGGTVVSAPNYTEILAGLSPIQQKVYDYGISLGQSQQQALELVNEYTTNINTAGNVIPIEQPQISAPPQNFGGHLVIDDLSGYTNSLGTQINATQYLLDKGVNASTIGALQEAGVSNQDIDDASKVALFISPTAPPIDEFLAQYQSNYAKEHNLLYVGGNLWDKFIYNNAEYKAPDGTMVNLNSPSIKAAAAAEYAKLYGNKTRIVADIKSFPGEMGMVAISQGLEHGWASVTPLQVGETILNAAMLTSPIWGSKAMELYAAIKANVPSLEINNGKLVVAPSAKALDAKTLKLAEEWVRIQNEASLKMKPATLEGDMFSPLGATARPNIDTTFKFISTEIGNKPFGYWQIRNLPDIDMPSGFSVSEPPPLSMFGSKGEVITITRPTAVMTKMPVFNPYVGASPYPTTLAAVPKAIMFYLNLGYMAGLSTETMQQAVNNGVLDVVVQQALDEQGVAISDYMMDENGKPVEMPQIEPSTITQPAPSIAINANPMVEPSIQTQIQQAANPAIQTSVATAVETATQTMPAVETALATQTQRAIQTRTDVAQAQQRDIIDEQIISTKLGSGMRLNKKERKRLEDLKKRKKYAGAITFQHGFGWVALKEPYYPPEENIAFFYGHPPMGAQVVQGGKGAAYRSIQMYLQSHDLPDIHFQRGIMKIHISKEVSKDPGATGAITFETTQRGRNYDDDLAVRMPELQAVDRQPQPIMRKSKAPSGFQLG